MFCMCSVFRLSISRRRCNSSRLACSSNSLCTCNGSMSAHLCANSTRRSQLSKAWSCRINLVSTVLSVNSFWLHGCNAWNPISYSSDTRVSRCILSRCSFSRALTPFRSIHKSHDTSNSFVMMDINHLLPVLRIPRCV